MISQKKLVFALSALMVGLFFSYGLEIPLELSNGDEGLRMRQVFFAKILLPLLATIGVYFSCLILDEVRDGEGS